MTETTSPARLIQSPAFIFTGSSTLIIDRGRAMFTLFLGDTTLGAECDRRASAEPLSGITTSYQPDGRTGDRATARRYAAVPGRSARCGAYCQRLSYAGTRRRSHPPPEISPPAGLPASSLTDASHARQVRKSHLRGTNRFRAITGTTGTRQDAARSTAKLRKSAPTCCGGSGAFTSASPRVGLSAWTVTPAEASRFITTSIQFPLRTGQRRVTVPVPAACPVQFSAVAGAGGGALPRDSGIPHRLARRPRRRPHLVSMR